MVTAKTRRVQRTDGAVARKTYSAQDTAKFKCWGSGAGNERWAAALLGDLVPAVRAVWADEYAEYAELSWIEGTVSTELAQENIHTAGCLLGRVHACRGTWWGSLDGRWRFNSATEAFADRFAAATRLLRRSDPELAYTVSAWSRRELPRLHLPGPPVLVHGDFGPGNIVFGACSVHVIDWEHSRWGAAGEDWAKIRLAAEFPEPNGFGSSEKVDALAAGWATIHGRAAPLNATTEQFLLVYYAVCLGVFFTENDFTENDVDRLAWVRDVTKG